MRRTVLGQPEFWTTVAAVVLLSVGHYAAPTHDPFWHDLFRRLYYLPIILAGFRYGLPGGLITAGAVSLVFLPHVLATRAMLPRQASEAVFEIPLYIVVGVVTGILRGRQLQAEQSLVRAERLKTLGETAAGMAHEVRNPLAAIRSSAQLLQKRVAGKDQELAGIVVAEADRLDAVVRDFLDYARPAPLRREPVRLSRLAAACVNVLKPVIDEKHVTVGWRTAEDDVDVSADPNQLRQVIMNLLLNALQALPAGGRVELTLNASGQRVALTVADNGPGFPADRLRRPFEPFQTTKAGGTGLGLAIAHRIVVEHGGDISIESQPGQGSRVTVSLPAE